MGNEKILDVRDDQAKGSDPFERIMGAVTELAPGQDLLLINTFEPLPLYKVMEKKGFGHQSRERVPGEWEIRFFRQGDA